MKALPVPRLTEKEQEEFWAQITKAGDDKCWEWTGNKHRIFHQTRAKRIAFSLVMKVPLDHLWLKELCGNQNCCNPHHQQAITKADASRHAIVCREKIKHKRKQLRTPTRPPMLSKEDRENIQKLWLSGMTLVRIRKLYDASVQDIADVIDDTGRI